MGVGRPRGLIAAFVALAIAADSFRAFVPSLSIHEPAWGFDGLRIVSGALMLTRVRRPAWGFAAVTQAMWLSKLVSWPFSAPDAMRVVESTALVVAVTLSLVLLLAPPIVGYVWSSEGLVAGSAAGEQSPSR